MTAGGGRDRHRLRSRPVYLIRVRKPECPLPSARFTLVASVNPVNSVKQPLKVTHSSKVARFDLVLHIRLPLLWSVMLKNLLVFDSNGVSIY